MSIAFTGNRLWGWPGTAIEIFAIQIIEIGIQFDLFIRNLRQCHWFVQIKNKVCHNLRNARIGIVRHDDKKKSGRVLVWSVACSCCKELLLELVAVVRRRVCVCERERGRDRASMQGSNASSLRKKETAKQSNQQHSHHAIRLAFWVSSWWWRIGRLGCLMDY